MDLIKNTQWGIPSIGLAVCIILLMTILQRIGLYTISQRRQIKNHWLVWLPFGNYFVLGSISDQLQDVVQGRRTYRRFLLPVLSLLGGIPLVALVICLAGIFFYLYVAVMSLGLIDLTDTIKPETQQWMMKLTIPMGILLICSLWGTVLHYMALYDLFWAASPILSKGKLVIIILFPILEPFYILSCRNKDQGMPQSTSTEPGTPTKSTPPPHREAPARNSESAYSTRSAFNKKHLGISIFWCIFFTGFVIFFISRCKELGWITPIVLTLVIEIPYILLMKKLGFVKTKGKILIDQSLVNGTYTTAVRTQYHSHSTYRSAKERREGRSMTRTEYWAIYEYHVDGRTYTQKRSKYRSIPPEEITLYYPAGNPHHAIAHENEILGLRYRILTVVVPALIALLIFCLTGTVNLRNLLI